MGKTAYLHFPFGMQAHGNILALLQEQRAEKDTFFYFSFSHDSLLYNACLFFLSSLLFGQHLESYQLATFFHSVHRYLTVSSINSEADGASTLAFVQLLLAGCFSHVSTFLACSHNLITIPLMKG